MNFLGIIRNSVQGRLNGVLGDQSQKSFYTGQCPEWGHPLDGALIVRWIGLDFFFSFESSYLRAPRKPLLDVAPVAGTKTSCCTQFHCAEWWCVVLNDP